MTRLLPLTLPILPFIPIPDPSPVPSLAEDADVDAESTRGAPTPSLVALLGGGGFVKNPTLGPLRAEDVSF